jgi:hypothetical protein
VNAVLINLHTAGFDPYELGRGIKRDTSSRCRVAFMLDSNNIITARLAMDAKIYGLVLNTDSKGELYIPRNRTGDGRTHLRAALTQQCSLSTCNGRFNIESADTERDQHTGTARSRSHDEDGCKNDEGIRENHRDAPEQLWRETRSSDQSATGNVRCEE